MSLRELGQIHQAGEGLDELNHVAKFQLPRGVQLPQVLYYEALYTCVNDGQ